VIGSGAKGYAYLGEHAGYLLQTPISWFSHARSTSDGTAGRWDLSPGFGPSVLGGRLVPASCLFCHADRPREHPEHPSRFVPPVFAGSGIGCERCHGPGERHVRTSERLDIVNPARLAPRLRDAVCEQCHLEGEARVLRAGRGLFDYRPGLPLNDFWAVLVRGRQAGEDAKAVNHVEQMYQSKCFSRPVGDRQLGCTTCHDPHVPIGPAEKTAYYRARCLLCHDGTEGPPVCSEPLTRRKQTSPGDNCADCHMPRYRSSDIAHTASTDHRVVRRPTRQPVHGDDLEGTPLVDFYRDRFPQGDPLAARTLGLGLVKLMRTNLLDPRRHADRALRLLEEALANDPVDVAVREGKVEAYLLLGRPAEALSEVETLLPDSPGDWPLLVQAAYATEACGERDRSRDCWRRVAEVNPAVPDHLVHLLDLLGRPEDAGEAWKCCEQLLRLDPFNVPGRQARVRLLLLQGRRDEARRESDLVHRLTR
jgi:predicted CXXCH cytochrome family protein